MEPFRDRAMRKTKAPMRGWLHRGPGMLHLEGDAERQRGQAQIVPIPPRRTRWHQSAARATRQNAWASGRIQPRASGELRRSKYEIRELAFDPLRQRRVTLDAERHRGRLLAPQERGIARAAIRIWALNHNLVHCCSYRRRRHGATGQTTGTYSYGIAASSAPIDSYANSREVRKSWGDQLNRENNLLT
jgi:hypothetical protein